MNARTGLFTALTVLVLDGITTLGLTVTAILTLAPGDATSAFATRCGYLATLCAILFVLGVFFILAMWGDSVPEKQVKLSREMRAELKKREQQIELDRRILAAEQEAGVEQ